MAEEENKELKILVREMVIEFTKQVEKHGWEYFNELDGTWSFEGVWRRAYSEKTESVSLGELERMVCKLASEKLVSQHVPVDRSVVYCTYSKTNRRGLSFYGQKKFDDVSNLRRAANTLSKYPDLKSAAESASIFADKLESLSDEEYEEQYAPKVESSGG